MDWIKQILDRHTDENGVLDAEAANAEIDREFPKQAVVKSVYNTKAKEAKDLQTKLDEVQGDAATVQDLKDQLAQAQNDLQAERTSRQVESVLKDAGATDIDYLTFKLGELELDDEGKVKDLDNRIKELKEQMPSFFDGTADGSDEGDGENDGDDDGSTPNGYEIIDNGLEGGKQPSQEATAAAEFERALGLTADTGKE